MSTPVSTSEFLTVNKIYIREIKSIVNNLTSKVTADTEKLNENFAYYLPWCGEDLWRNTYCRDFFKGLLEELEGDYAAFVLGNKIELLKGHCRRSYNVRENSTGSLHREISTWRFICDLENLNTLENIFKNS